MKPTFIAYHILMGWPRATAGVTLTMLLAGCPAKQPDESEQEFPPSEELRLTIEPSRLVARQNSSVVLHVDTPDAAEVDLPSGYAFDLDEVVGQIDVTTAPCPPGTGSRACQDWTITPRAGSVPGTYFVNVEAVGSRAGRAAGSFGLTVVADPAPDFGAALHVAGNPNFTTAVINGQHKLFVNGSSYQRDAPLRALVGYRRFDLAVDPIGPLQDLGFEPRSQNEFIDAQFPADANWIGVSGRFLPLAVRDDGTVWRLEGASPEPIPGLANVVAVRGETPNLAVLRDGRVMEFGRVVVRINEGNTQTVTSAPIDPRPYCEEYNFRVSPPTCIRELTDVRSIAAVLEDEYMFLKRDGTVTASNGGQRPASVDAPTPALAVAISTSFRTVTRIVLAAEGTVWMSLRNGHFGAQAAFAPVPGLDDVIAIDPVEFSEDNVVSALRRDGTVWVWNADDSGGAPVQLQGLSDIVGLESGYALQGPCGDGGGRLWLIHGNLSVERLHGFGDHCGNTARVSISVAVIGQGRIVSEPASIECPTGPCRGFFPRGSRVRLWPAPALGWAFSSWGGDPACVAINRSLDASTPILSADINCTVTFIEGGERRLQLQLDGDGTVTSTPEGIDCGPDCSESYPLETTVVLTASPALGYRFDRFVGHQDCSDGSLTMTAVRTCAARFETLPAPAAPSGLTATAESNAVLLRWNAVNGPVTRYSLERADDGGAFAVLLEDIPGTAAEFRDGSALADQAHTYRLIAHNLNGASPAVAVSIGTTPPVAARTLTVRISNDGDGRVTSQPAGIDCSRVAGNTANCTHNFANGSVIQLIATPDAGFVLSEWRGDPDCADGQVTLDANRQCEAAFESDAAMFFLQFVPANIVGAGRVETDDLRIVCPIGDCAASYVSGSLVRVRAVPDANALLEAWTGDCASFPATQTTIQFVITRNTSCGAIFATRGP